MNKIKWRGLLEKQSTPMYAYDLSVLEERIRSLRSCLPEGVRLCYAVKANTFILATVSALVDRLEICSPGELRICYQMGLPTNKFVVSGVYKTPALIRELIAQGPSGELYTVESMHQFSILSDTAHLAKKRISILLRLTSGNQFGLSEDELEHIVSEYQHDPFLEIRGIQYFSGTQKSSLKRLKRELDYLDSVLNKLQTDRGYSAPELEFGPGLPVSYFIDEDFDEDAFLHQFSALLTRMQFKTKLTLELGRSIAASCGTYLTSVVDKKTNKGQNYAIVDGGIHQLIYYGQSMAMKHPIVHELTHRGGTEHEPWNICGSLCTTNDILVKQFPMYRPEIGDVIVFENAGAYCAAEGIALFLSRDLPAVMLLKNGCEPVCVRGHMPIEMLNTPNNEMRERIWND